VLATVFIRLRYRGEPPARNGVITTPTPALGAVPVAAQGYAAEALAISGLRNVFLSRR
jgi:hypothetical protein